jgi:hypothetical protein
LTTYTGYSPSKEPKADSELVDIEIIYRDGHKVEVKGLYAKSFLQFTLSLRDRLNDQQHDEFLIAGIGGSATSIISLKDILLVNLLERFNILKA